MDNVKMSKIVYKNLNSHTIVISPPISRVENGDIAKIFGDDVNFDHERHIACYMRQSISDVQDFAIQPIKYNYIDASLILKHVPDLTTVEYNELISGKLDPMLDRTLAEVIYPYGGIELGKYNPLYCIGSNYFIKASRPLFYGLTKMYGRICHNDIKPSNIVYDTETNQMRFIDFGTAMILKNNYNYRDTIYHSIGNFQSMQFYEFWSPEVAILMNYKVNHMNSRALSDIIKYYTNEQSSYYKICHHVLRRPELVKMAKIDFADLAEHIHMSSNNPFRNKENMFIMNTYNRNFYKSHIKNIDIYSLGISLGIILYKLRVKIGIDPSHPMCDLIAKMITIDYRGRITPDEALALFDEAIAA